MKLKEALSEKQELLSQKEFQILELQNKIGDISKKLKEMKSNEDQCLITCANYENLFKKMLLELQEVLQEKQALEMYANKLDSAFAELLSKYEQAKFVIQGLIENENALKNQIKHYEKIVEQIGEHYNNLHDHATDKLSKASAKLNKTDRKHIAETAKLRAEILQSKVRINDLEKKILMCNNNKGGTGDNISEFSMFAPLKNHLIR